jgi:hypothetical protein
MDKPSCPDTLRRILLQYQYDRSAKAVVQDSGSAQSIERDVQKNTKGNYVKGRANQLADLLDYFNFSKEILAEIPHLKKFNWSKVQSNEFPVLFHEGVDSQKRISLYILSSKPRGDTAVVINLTFFKGSDLNKAIDEIISKGSEKGPWGDDGANFELNTVSHDLSLDMFLEMSHEPNRRFLNYLLEKLMLSEK